MIYRSVIQSWFEMKLIDYLIYNVIIDDIFICKIKFELGNKKKKHV